MFFWLILLLTVSKVGMHGFLYILTDSLESVKYKNNGIFSSTESSNISKRLWILSSPKIVGTKCCFKCK